MDGLRTMLFVGIAIFSIVLAAPIVVPLWEGFMGSMEFMPKRY